jgi:hypothetical protein
MRYAAVGLSLGAAAEDREAPRFSQALRLLKKTKPPAAALNAIQPACE